MKNFELQWPEGTIDKKTPDGKREVKFSKPTDMKEEHKNQRKEFKESTKDDILVNNDLDLQPQMGGVDNATKKDDWGPLDRSQKHFHTRQEELNKNRKDERDFKEEQRQAA